MNRIHSACCYRYRKLVWSIVSKINNKIKHHNVQDEIFIILLNVTLRHRFQSIVFLSTYSTAIDNSRRFRRVSTLSKTSRFNLMVVFYCNLHILRFLLGFLFAWLFWFTQTQCIEFLRVFKNVLYLTSNTHVYIERRTGNLALVI